MQLAKPLYRGNNELMLACGVSLSRRYIDSIRRLRYPGIYIDDDISKDIEIVNSISDELRRETMTGLSKIYITAQQGGKANNRLDINRQVEDIVDELLCNQSMMLNMIDLRSFDSYTYSHSVNVAVLSIIIGIVFNHKKDDLIKLGLGALLHDIGKVFISKDILNKEGPLTENEFDIIKTHPQKGYDYVVDRYNMPILSRVTIADHHEKYDGSGYPKGKKKSEISLFGRITSVSDVYDALTSERPYRKALSPSEAVEYIMGGSGTLFDPDVVRVFTKKVAPYPVGSSVKLSNGWVGLVIENYESFCLRPLIRIFQEDGKQVTPFEISLKDDMEYLNVTIEGLADGI
jgi:HD-GYP domain-containing protein (c-di-GMP phosphodiesterase class II)